VATKKLGNDGETLLFEMGIKGERGFDPQSAHGLETHTINQTEVAPPCGEQGADAGTVYFAVNKMNAHDWENIFLKKSYGIHAESALHQRAALHKYVIACKAPFVAIQETGPCSNSLFMIGVCAIKKGIQC